MSKKQKEFIRVCFSLDKDSIELLNELADKHNMSKSVFIKFLLLHYKTTFGYSTPWLRGKP